MKTGKDAGSNSRKARVVLAVLVLAGILGIISIFSRFPQRSVRTKDRPELKTREEQLQKLKQDSDNDGLRDWEEAIFKTDPQKADTDGDGTIDGEEIALNRDPLLKGPDSTLATSTLSTATTTRSFARNFTTQLAEKFGQRFLVPRLVRPDAPVDLEALSATLAEEISSVPFAAIPRVKYEELTLSPDIGKESLASYRRALDLAVAPFKKFENTPEILIFAAAMRDEDFSRLAALDPYLKTFAAVLPKLKKIAVPSNVALLHLDYLNAGERQHEAVKLMRRAGEDMVGAVAGAKEYVKTAQDLAAIVRKLQQEFQKAGIPLQ